MNTYLGFDYGTTNIAIGEISWKPFSYFVKLDSKKDAWNVHNDIEEFLDSSLLGGYNYLKSNHHAFIEGVFKGPNVKTYEGMVRVAHSVYLLLSEYGNGVSVSYITPSEWRKIIFGKGNIKKEECQEWAYEKWPFLLDYKKSEQSHRADALMIAEAGRLLTEANEKETRRSGNGKND